MLPNLRENSELVWKSRWAGVSFIAIGTFIAGSLECWIPAPGVAVAVMGVLAALMASRDKASGFEKAAWMLLISALLLIEIQAIRKDRKEHDDQMTKLLIEEMSAGVKQRLTLRILATGSQLLFSKAADSSRKLLVWRPHNSKPRWARHRINLNHMTGGNTFTVVTLVPVPLENSPNTFRLALSLRGNNPLFDVTVQLTTLPAPKTFNMTDFVSGKSTNNTIFSASSLSPRRAIMLPTVTVSPDQQSNFSITTLARNGDFVETLHIRKNGNDVHTANGLVSAWEYSYEITRSKTGRNHREYMVPLAKLKWLRATFIGAQTTP